jgi:hypothetical protein
MEVLEIISCGKTRKLGILPVNITISAINMRKRMGTVTKPKLRDNRNADHDRIGENE